MAEEPPSNPREGNVYWGWGRSRKSLRVISSPPRSTYTASSFAHTTSPSFASRVTSLEGMQVDIHHILSELQAERARLDRVITALEGLSAGSAPRRGRPAKPEQSSTAVPHKKTMALPHGPKSLRQDCSPKPARAKGGITPKRGRLGKSTQAANGKFCRILDDGFINRQSYLATDDNMLRFHSLSTPS